MTRGASLRERLAVRVLPRVRPAPLASLLKRLLNLQRRDVQTDMGTFWVDPASDFGARVVETGGYEPWMVEVLQAYLKPGSTFVDAGANEGYFTVVAGNITGPTGRVIGIEPQQRLQPVLERNLALNAVTTASIYPLALSDAAGEATLYLSSDMNTGSTGLARRTRYRGPVARVETATLGAIIDHAGLHTVDLLKMDIEGLEYEAILGSKPLFESGRVRAITLEVHPAALVARGLDGGDIMRFLAACGYRESPRFGASVLVAGDNAPDAERG